MKNRANEEEGLVSLHLVRISEAEVKGKKTVTSRENTVAKNEKKEKKKNSGKDCSLLPYIGNWRTM